MSDESRSNLLWWIRWAEHGELSVRDPEAVESTLDSLWARFSDKPSLVEIEAPSGTCLTIVAGTRQTYLNYIPLDASSPSCTSVGDRGPGKFSYYDFGVLVDVDRRHVVSSDAGRKAVGEFLGFDGEALPHAVQWEEI